MFRLAHSELLWLYLALPALAGLYALYAWWRRRALRRFGERPLIDRLFADKSRSKPLLKFILLCGAAAALVFALCGPQIGTRSEEVKRKGSDVIVCLDVSNSMNAEDIRPSRLERARQAVYRLIERMQGDRIGLIVFAGQAYVQLPVTTDYNAARLFLSSVNSGMVPTQGTAIGAALDLALRAAGDTLRKNTAVVVITDGENHEDDAVEAAREAAARGMTVHTLGMGTPAGAPVPLYRNRQRVGFLQDGSGQTVVTRLDAGALNAIADAGRGRFVRASNNDDGLDLILQEINAMEKTEFGSRVFTDYDDQFQYFAGLALLLLAIEFVVSERKSRWIQKLNLFKVQRHKEAA
jgi:Ca-activated chloride channel family protein